MSYRTLLSHVVLGDGLPQRLAAVADVARMFEAEVIGLGARAPWPFSDEHERGGPSFQRLVEDARAELAKTERAFLKHSALFPLGARWEADASYPDRAIARAAAAADLVLAFRCGPVEDLSTHADPASLVMEIGAPVLIMAEPGQPLVGDTVVAAWKNTREARRALTAALPFLVRAERVILFSVCETGAEDEMRIEQARVLRRLERHGVRAEAVVEPGSADEAGERLLDKASSNDAELIVAGAFGHSRLREWVLGGVTRELLAQPSPYLLLCH